MFRSMTAFGRAEASDDERRITVELKSVNNRFFECSVRMPRSLGFTDDRIKPYLASKGISRGKVDVSINVDRIVPPPVKISLDTSYADGYIAALNELRDHYELEDDISVMTVAADKSIFTFERNEEDGEHDWEQVSAVLDGAVEAFIAGRCSEGERLRADLDAKIAAIGGMVDEIEKLSSADRENCRARIEERLRKTLGDLKINADENRILTECAIYADKVAIDEELVRLRSHFNAYTQISDSAEPAGRKLDFLLQEMNREINTIGSKCQNAATAHIVVDVKCEIEKIREQIQNIE